jgi:hypothetical protein
VSILRERWRCRSRTLLSCRIESRKRLLEFFLRARQIAFCTRDMDITVDGFFLVENPVAVLLHLVGIEFPTEQETNVLNEH